MSVIPLSTAKEFLEVIHSASDSKIQRLLDSAEAEALLFMNRSRFSGECCEVADPDEPDMMPPSMETGVLLLLQAVYEANPDDAKNLRRAAEIKLHPLRCDLGV